MDKEHFLKIILTIILAVLTASVNGQKKITYGNGRFGTYETDFVKDFAEFDVENICENINLIKCGKIHEVYEAKNTSVFEHRKAEIELIKKRRDLFVRVLKRFFVYKEEKLQEHCKLLSGYGRLYSTIEAELNAKSNAAMCEGYGDEYIELSHNFKENPTKENEDAIVNFFYKNFDKYLDAIEEYRNKI